METERLDVKHPDGRNVAIWRSWEPSVAGDRVVVMNAGFARRMRHIGPVALYFTRNGAVTYRYDSVDHIGLSDGDIFHYSATPALGSMRVTLDLALERERVQTATLFAASLAARPAFRLAATDSRIDRVVTLVGVVDLRQTLARALGRDYTVVPFDELPPSVEFERHQMDPRPEWLDILERGWGDIEATIRDLSATPAPCVNFGSAADQWVTPEELRRAFNEGRNGPRYLFELPNAEHDISANPVAVRIALTKLTQALITEPELWPTLGDGDGPPIVEPSFEEVVELIVAERELERAQLRNARGR